MTIILLNCREDEERQNKFPSNKASSSILETKASFTNGTILMEI